MRKSLAGMFLAGIGVTVVLLDISLRAASWYTERSYDLDHNIVIPGVIIGFVGFWMIDSIKTKEAVTMIGDFIPRFGRRKSDAVAIPESVTTTAAVLVEQPGAKETTDGSP